MSTDQNPQVQTIQQIDYKQEYEKLSNYLKTQQNQNPQVQTIQQIDYKQEYEKLSNYLKTQQNQNPQVSPASIQTNINNNDLINQIKNSNISVSVQNPSDNLNSKKVDIPLSNQEYLEQFIKGKINFRDVIGISVNGLFLEENKQKFDFSSLKRTDLEHFSDEDWEKYMKATTNLKKDLYELAEEIQRRDPIGFRNYLKNSLNGKGSPENALFANYIMHCKIIDANIQGFTPIKHINKNKLCEMSYFENFIKSTDPNYRAYEFTKEQYIQKINNKDSDKIEVSINSDQDFDY